jgi:hypothetical protein
MGYEKMERRFPCPCGKGVQVSEWEEHDTWVHGNEGGPYKLECEDCAAQYESYWSVGQGQVWILKEDKGRLDSLESEAKEKQAKLQEIVVERYEESFVSHVLGLRNRTEMKYALHTAASGFFKNAKGNPSYVEGVARESIRAGPRETFGELRVQDSEVSGIMAEIDSLKREIGELRGRMEKIPVPDRWGKVQKMP